MEQTKQEKLELITVKILYVLHILGKLWTCENNSSTGIKHIFF